MAPLPIKLNPKALTLAHSLRPLSSSPHLPDLTSSADNNQQPPSPSPPPPSPPPRSSYASLFSDIKDRLKSPPPPPRRIPSDPPPPQFSNPVPSQPAASLDDVRKHLAEFRRRRDPNPNPNPSFGPAPDRPASFQELFKNSALRNDANLKPEGGGRSGQLSFESIRESLRQFQSGPKDPINFRSQFTFRPSAPDQTPLVGDQEKPQESIFGKEMREKLGEKEGEEEMKALKTEFVKMYSYDELGEKLRKLRPEGAAKGGKDWFSLSELNVRLAKLRELEEKETESKMGGVSFRDLRESLLRLKEADSNKKANMQKLSSLVNIGLPMMQSFLLKPPQEQLLEKYFHPDHMSSAEKMKLELKKVRDEFKMSESDCGSSRVQIAQLTTKIKHLSSALHKKDKHSRKGLHDMVQRRKKLLKYLRRTDWDSYCFVLSKLGLRDVPEYKTPDYKT